jgi:hypothetical protein
MRLVADTSGLLLYASILVEAMLEVSFDTCARCRGWLQEPTMET